MFKHNTSTSLVQSALILAMVVMICAATAAQKGPTSTTGAPLKGVDVKLSRYGGAQFGGGGMSSFRAKTNEKGEFKLGVVPAGKYDLIVSPPPDLPETQPGKGPDPMASNLNLSKSNINRLAIAIDGVKGGSIKKDIELKLKDGEASRHVGQPKYENISVTIETDGKSEVKGTIAARGAYNNPS